MEFEQGAISHQIRQAMKALCTYCTLQQIDPKFIKFTQYKFNDDDIQRQSEDLFASLTVKMLQRNKYDPQYAAEIPSINYVNKALFKKGVASALAIITEKFGQVFAMSSLSPAVVVEEHKREDGEGNLETECLTLAKNLAKELFDFNTEIEQFLCLVQNEYTEYSIQKKINERT